MIELVLVLIAYGWSHKEFHYHHPYLTMAQIHSALAYYWDHKTELEHDIERRLQPVDQVRQTTQPPSLVERLKAKGLI